MTIVSAVQFAPRLLDVRFNMTTALIMVHEAAAKGARIIVLPEMCMGGFNVQNGREAMQVAQQKDGYQTEAFIPLAQTYGCNIVVGYVELCEGKLYNSAIVIGAQGVIMNVQKHNLFGADFRWATPSEAMHQTTITEAGRLGVLICRDVMNNYRNSYRFYREDHKFYKRGNVDVVALPTNWGNGFGYPDASWSELAESIDTNVIISNRTGFERDMKYKGGSAVITRSGKIWTNGSSFDAPSIVGGIIEL